MLYFRYKEEIKEDRTMKTWAVVEPYINNKGIEETALVCWTYSEESARELANKKNLEENTTKYTIEEVEMFDTRDSF